MGARDCGCDPRFNIVCLTHARIGVPEVTPVVDNTSTIYDGDACPTNYPGCDGRCITLPHDVPGKPKFERSYIDHLSEMTDTEVLMLGVGLAILRAEAKSITPEQRYSYPIARVAEELHIRAMRRF